MLGATNNKKVVEINNSIQFFRKDAKLIGKVVGIRDNTVMIEVCNKTAAILDIPNNFTVVNHKNYVIIA